MAAVILGEGLASATYDPDGLQLLVATVPTLVGGIATAAAFARVPHPDRGAEVEFVRAAGFSALGLHVAAFVAAATVASYLWDNLLVLFAPPIFWSWTVGFGYALLPEDVQHRAWPAVVAAAVTVLLPVAFVVVYIYALSQMGPV